MKNLILIKDPEIDLVDMPTLVGIAHAIEHESVQRYAGLAEQMERQGEAATAAAFRVLLEEERKHIDAVAHWAGKLGQRVPTPDAHAWQLPEDLSSSWTDIEGSTLLSPYRAFALAVENEQRAFSFYTYLAARAEDERVMAEAEKLAIEELHHAALMRRFRRRAYHRERRPARMPDISITSDAALRQVIATHEAAIARAHRELAARLRIIGDEESARLLEEQSYLSRHPAGQGDALNANSATEGSRLDPMERDPVRLLVQAQQPLEAFSETLEAVMRTTEGELFAQAEAAMVEAVRTLSLIALQSAKRMHEKTDQPVPAEPHA